MAESHIANQFSGLPISDLISAPLTAACDAQVALAQATANFIRQVGLDEKTNQVRMVAFKFQRPQENAVSTTSGVEYGTEEVELNVPFLSLVNTPALAIKKVNITFDMEVKEATSEKSTTDASLTTDATISTGFFVKAKVNVKGSVSTHKENTRNTDNSAKYHVSVEAEDSGMPEGLSRVYDIMQSAIAPRKIKAVSDSSASGDAPQLQGNAASAQETESTAG